MNSLANSHYAEGAYDSQHIPSQPSQICKHAGLLTATRPWGNTENIAPYSFFDQDSSKRLRELKENERKKPGTRLRNETVFHIICSQDQWGRSN